MELYNLNMKYLSCIQNVTFAIILYYLYSINSNIDTIKQEFVTIEKEEDVSKIDDYHTIEFNYACCEPIFISIELSTLLNIKKQICNFYELISILNNYLYEHELLELQHVTLTKPLKHLIDVENESFPYYKFIEVVLDKHVHKYI